MDYFLSFIEGITTFISPCLLPMLPIYIFYFAGSEGDKKSTLINAIAFVTGFSVLFIILGAFAGFFGSLLRVYEKQFNLITGGIVIFFGLNHLGILKFNIFGRLLGNDNKKVEIKGVFSAMSFGMVFSISWLPCAGAFLSSALMLASQKATVKEGVFMLLAYSLGLGIPFVLSAVLIDQLKTAFDWIKKNYNIINNVSGIVLILMGILMATGYLGYLLRLLSF